MVLILLLSGLPWTQVWGGGFKELQKIMNWSSPGQEWFVTLQSKSHLSVEDGLDLWQISEQEETVSLKSNKSSSSLYGITIDDVVKRIGPEKLKHPIWILPPKGDNGVWTVRSMTQYRPDRMTLHYDKWNGEEIMRIVFSDYHLVKQVASYGHCVARRCAFWMAKSIVRCDRRAGNYWIEYNWSGYMVDS